jgi:hypothetical protein
MANSRGIQSTRRHAVPHLLGVGVFQDEVAENEEKIDGQIAFGKQACRLPA